MQNSSFEKAVKPTFQTRSGIHRHWKNHPRLVKLLAFVVALLFDGSFEINISIQHQANLNDNFEGQGPNCSTKTCSECQIFHILVRLPSLFKKTILPL